MNKRISEFLSNMTDKNRKIMFLVVCGAAAIALIAVSDFTRTRATQKAQLTSDENVLDTTYERELEQRLESIISQMDGVGRVKVMVKSASSEKSDYARNSDSSYGSDGDEKQDSEYVIVKSQSQEGGILIKKDYPEIQGVFVVCDGGESSSVKNEVTNAVSALLGIGKNSISVSKMKNSED